MIRNANPVVVYAVAFFATLVIGGLILALIWS